MPAEFAKAPEVAEIARQLIVRVPDHHTLVECHIEYMFIAEAPVSKGRVRLGCVRKISGRNAWLVSLNDERERTSFLPGAAFFLMEISRNTWLDLDDNQRIALVDHELSHCSVGHDDDGELVLATRSHDVEEFVSVLSRNGLWKRDVQALGVVAAEQLSLAVDRVEGHANAGVIK